MRSPLIQLGNAASVGTIMNWQPPFASTVNGISPQSASHARAGAGEKRVDPVPTTRILCPLPRHFRFATEDTETLRLSRSGVDRQREGSQSRQAAQAHD
jgi:hypothetical protein